MDDRSVLGRWLRRPQPAGDEPRRARSAYRTRLVLAAFGLVVAGGAALFFAFRAAGDGGSAEVVAAALFGLIALGAVVNVIVVGLRWHGAGEGPPRTRPDDE